MLVLSRKTGERIHLGKDIVITVIRLKNNQVRIGIEAPDDVEVLRGELQPMPKTIRFDLPEEGSAQPLA